MPQSSKTRKPPPALRPAIKAPPVIAPPPAAPEANGAAAVEDPKVLDLTALIPSRQLVKLPTKRHPEGETFELRLVDDFGIEMQQRLLAWSRKYQELMTSEDELDDDQTARLRFLFENLVENVLDAPDVAKRGMDDAAKSRAIQAFSWAPVLAQQQAQMVIVSRLVDRKLVTQEAVDEIMAEIRLDAAKLTSES